MPNLTALKIKNMILAIVKGLSNPCLYSTG